MARLRRLIAHFGDIDHAWQATANALRASRILDERTLTAFVAKRAELDLDAYLKAIERLGAWIITLDDPAYPPLLKEIHDPPFLLYIKGTLLEADHLAIAVIGTRNATGYGKTMTAKLITPLAERGVTIVSGLALGIDTAAHQTALAAGGRTLAILPCGLDRIYPAGNEALADKIIDSGALISELPLGTPPDRHHFPPRNRIVSGLSMGDLVIEAGEKSGTLITTDMALQQGRDVFAVPGNVSSPSSVGTNRLIQQGAALIMSAEDVLNGLKLDAPKLRVAGISNTMNTMEAPPSKATAPRIAPNMTAEKSAVVAVLSKIPLPIHDVVHRSGLLMRDVLRILTALELNDIVTEVGIMEYMLSDAL